MRFEGHFQPLSWQKILSKIINKQSFFSLRPFYNAAPPLIYLNIDVMDIYIVFENSAHVLQFRIYCATILVIVCPLNKFCNA